MKKFSFVSLICILLLCGCDNKTNNNQLENEIKENFVKIPEVSDLASSNPYDYINNEYYRSIINLGEDAVPVLKELFEKGELSGVDAYISALAIQDITKCNLYDEYDLDWSTAEEFYEFWEDNNCGFN